MRVFDLDDDECDLDQSVIIDFGTGQPVNVYIPGPPGSNAGALIETETTDTELIIGATTQYVVVWALAPIEIFIPLASARLTLVNGRVYALPITIKNETGVQITLTPTSPDTLEITSEAFQNQSVTLLPRTGGYSAI